MLYFLVAFIALTTIKQWNPLFSNQTTIDCSTSPLSKYHNHGYRYMAGMAYNFPSIDHHSMGCIESFYGITAGHKTHIPGHKTHIYSLKTHNFSHTTAGHEIQYIQCHYSLMTHCMTSRSISISSKWHCNVTNHYGMSNKLFYPSCQCRHTIIMPVPHIQSEKAENHTILFLQLHSKSVIVSIYILPHKHCSNSQFDQKCYKHYKYSALPLVLAINHCIYYLLNGTFNHDIDRLINRLLLKLQQYITRRNDFKHRWFTLLLSGLLSLLHISSWFPMVLFLRMHIVAWKLSCFKRMIYTMNLTIEKTALPSSWLQFILGMTNPW